MAAANSLAKRLGMLILTQIKQLPVCAFMKELLTGLDACMSSYKDFLGPNTILTGMIRMLNPREQAKAERLKILYKNHEICRCHTFQACSFVCPKEINVAHFIALAKVRPI